MCDPMSPETSGFPEWQPRACRPVVQHPAAARDSTWKRQRVRVFAVKGASAAQWAGIAQSRRSNNGGRNLPRQAVRAEDRSSVCDSPCSANAGHASGHRGFPVTNPVTGQRRKRARAMPSRDTRHGSVRRHQRTAMECGAANTNAAHDRCRQSATAASAVR